MAVFGQTEPQLAREAIREALDLSGRGLNGLPLATMHVAKKLELRCVGVIPCDDDIVPRVEQIKAIVDHADLKELYNTERHLLYVAWTRTRHHCLITSAEPFLISREILKED